MKKVIISIYLMTVVLAALSNPWGTWGEDYKNAVFQEYLYKIGRQDLIKSDYHDLSGADRMIHDQARTLADKAWVDKEYDMKVRAADRLLNEYRESAPSTGGSKSESTPAPREVDCRGCEKFFNKL